MMFRGRAVATKPGTSTGKLGLVLRNVRFNEEVQWAKVLGGITGSSQLGNEGFGLGDPRMHHLLAGGLRTLVDCLKKP